MTSYYEMPYWAIFHNKLQEWKKIKMLLQIGPLEKHIWQLYLRRDPKGVEKHLAFMRLEQLIYEKVKWKLE